MYEFINNMYKMGRITEKQVRSFAPKWITWEQVDKILRGEE